MKILETKYIREADQYTILNEPILSVDLMERAAIQLFHALVKKHPEPVPVGIFAGPGNNGGDGIALARMLAYHNYPVDLFIMNLGGPLSPDSQINLDRLPAIPWLQVIWLEQHQNLPEVRPNSIVIDALFGSGLKRSLTGYPAKLVRFLNTLPNQKIAIDIPSGLFGEDNSDNSMDAVFRADDTFTIHCPKFSMLMPEYAPYVGDWEAIDIGLDPEFIEQLPSAGRIIVRNDVVKHMEKRQKFSHKGVFGHALLFAGSRGKIGAAILSASSCLRSGVGLLTCHVPRIGETPVQATVPEAMLSIDRETDVCSTVPDLTSFTAIGAGPGLGLGKKQTELVETLIMKCNLPLVLDADALNILASQPELLDRLPRNTILTPHPGEFKRLFGSFSSHQEMIRFATEQARDRQLVILLKGAHTAIACPDGELYFNNTGNPGMATAGSGDVLTGIILSLLAQKYHAVDAALMAVHLHGAAGDIAAGRYSEPALLASDLIGCLGEAFRKEPVD